MRPTRLAVALRVFQRLAVALVGKKAYGVGESEHRESWVVLDPICWDPEVFGRRVDVSRCSHSTVAASRPTEN